VPVPGSVPPSLPHPVIKQVPLFTKQQSDSQEIYEQKEHNGAEHAVSAPETYKVSIPEDNSRNQARSDDVIVYKIPETHRSSLPETIHEHFSVPEPSKYQNYPEENDQRSPEDYQQPQSAGISSHEFSAFVDPKGHVSSGVEGSGYLSQGHREPGHGFSYQSFKTC
jgi:hypothetical protein